MNSIMDITNTSKIKGFKINGPFGINSSRVNQVLNTIQVNSIILLCIRVVMATLGEAHEKWGLAPFEASWNAMT